MIWSWNSLFEHFLNSFLKSTEPKKKNHLNFCIQNLPLLGKWKTFCRVAFVTAERKKLVGHCSQKTYVFISSWAARFLCDLVTPPYLRFPFVMLDNKYDGKARPILRLQKLFAAPCQGSWQSEVSFCELGSSWDVVRGLGCLLLCWEEECVTPFSFAFIFTDIGEAALGEMWSFWHSVMLRKPRGEKRCQSFIAGVGGKWRKQSSDHQNFILTSHSHTRFLFRFVQTYPFCLS